ncbi:EPIDERMAL PATTERNING FACTOR-like protein 2 [Cornus florida]|uniref:EPIDERMAL PATTERNING FACTOR-like protein 2 n=1 Tax=Cornus florida TaxID=4283 RepID=UPI0028A04FC8|nr:EPIDERMAL PATTERNING FACTOR-like protein 2 [Cornus florida]
MGCLHTCICCQRRRHLIISLLFLLVSSLTLVRFMAEGRTISKLVESHQMGREERVVVMRSLIGSSPPRCERKCSSCGHCEAIQVPVVPQFNGHNMMIMSNGLHLVATVPTIEYARGDYISNYKPMCWKCKCGELLFNP